MLELAILGFLYDASLHGYGLRKRIAALAGHVRPVSEGTLYPAIKRMERSGWLHRQTQPGAAAAPRHMLSLTATGRAELRHRLAEPSDQDITDENRWFTVLAFLRHLDDPAQQAALLRRLAFLQQPSSFLYDGDRPVRAEETDDPFRRGLLTIAHATSEAELRWLTETLTALQTSPASPAL